MVQGVLHDDRDDHVHERERGDRHVEDDDEHERHILIEKVPTATQAGKGNAQTIFHAFEKVLKVESANMRVKMRLTVG